MTTTLFLTKLFLMFTLLTDAAVVIVVVCLVAAAVLPGVRKKIRPAVSSLGPNVSWICLVLAGVATAGSLYYSLGAHYVPCTFCWYQRIAMYPLAVIFLVGVIRKDRDDRHFAFPIAIIGAILAAWHKLIELGVFSEGGSCAAAGPSCASPPFIELRYVTLAWMALSAFVLIALLLVLDEWSVRIAREQRDGIGLKALGGNETGGKELGMKVDGTLDG